MENRSTETQVVCIFDNSSKTAVHPKCYIFVTPESVK